MDPMALQPYEIGCLREREREKKKRRERQGERERDREGAPFVLFASQCLNGQVSYTLELIKKLEFGIQLKVNDTYRASDM